MMLHEELRRARETAGLSQAALSARTGVPRNQIVRAERGDNITLDTLRRLAAHLPLTKLTLLDNVDLRVDVLPEPEKLYIGAAETVAKLADAMAMAIRQVAVARAAMIVARQVQPLPEAGEPGGDIDAQLLFKRLQHLVDTVNQLMGRETEPESEEPQVLDEAG